MFKFLIYPGGHSTLAFKCFKWLKCVKYMLSNYCSF